MENSEIDSFNIDNIIEYSQEKLKDEVKVIGKGIPTIFKNFTHCEEIYNNITGEDEYKSINKFKNL